MYIYNHINANIPAFIVSAGMFVWLDGLYFTTFLPFSI